MLFWIRSVSTEMAANIDSVITIVKTYIAQLEKKHIPINEAILYGSFLFASPQVFRAN
jgi:hypothetical protein